GADHAGGDLVSLAAGERRIVHHEVHGERRRIDWLGRQRPYDVEVAYRVGDGRSLETRNGHDIARIGLVERHALETAESQHLGDAGLLDLAAVAGKRLQDHVGPD